VQRFHIVNIDVSVGIGSSPLDIQLQEMPYG